MAGAGPERKANESFSDEAVSVIFQRCQVTFVCRATAYGESSTSPNTIDMPLLRDASSRPRTSRPILDYSVVRT